MAEVNTQPSYDAQAQGASSSGNPGLDPAASLVASVSLPQKARGHLCYAAFALFMAAALTTNQKVKELEEAEDLKQFRKMSIAANILKSESLVNLSSWLDRLKNSGIAPPAMKRFLEQISGDLKSFLNKQLSKDTGHSKPWNPWDRPVADLVEKVNEGDSLSGNDLTIYQDYLMACQSRQGQINNWAKSYDNEGKTVTKRNATDYKTMMSDISTLQQAIQPFSNIHQDPIPHS